MDVSFFPSPSYPRGRARDALDDLLAKGTSRVMVACAYCSGAGIAVMRPHLARLRAPGSCLVVSADSPTDVEAVNNLARQAPGAVWLHETGNLPNEKRVGHALMHSKVFYAEAGDDVWLWVGSHNLTGRAVTGANLEAALLLIGHRSEPPFHAAREHIEACRAEASLCPVDPPPEPEGESVDVVVVHAETNELPTSRTPWHVRLGLRSAEVDWSLRPPAEVRLHLYRRGELEGGWQHSDPWASYGGTLTGLNLTDIHPAYAGMAASWDEAHYSITEGRSVLQFSRTPPDAGGIVTQAVINIEALVPSDEAFLPAKPKSEREEQTERRVLDWTDEDLASFFTKPSIQQGRLVYEIRHRGRANWKLSKSDLRESDQRLLEEEAEARQIRLLDVFEERRSRHPLIMRAKFRLRQRLHRPPRES